MFIVYIIYSTQLDKFYTGHTSDIKKRLSDHNSGISIFTSKATDWELKYTETYDTRGAALFREKEIKKKKSRKYILELINE